MAADAAKPEESAKQDEGSAPVAAEGSVPEAEGEERQGCALETVTKLSKKDTLNMYIHQVKAVGNIAFLLFFIIFAAVRLDWGIFLSYVLFATLHALVRSLMDWKYDTAALQGGAKKRRALTLLALNLMQMRTFYDARGCLSAGVVGMSINMTLIAQALVKLVPMNVVNIINLHVVLAEPNINIPKLLVIVCLLGQICGNFFGVMRTITSFELMTNAAKAGPVAKFIYVYFASDAMVRGLSLGVVMFAMVYNEDFPSLLAIVPPLVVYVNRSILMSAMYIQRGFVYHPTAPATTDGSSTCQKIFFGFFPAGFVQLFTDFPFNGDLASKRSFFAAHQAISSTESALFVVVAITVYDYIDMIARKWFLYLVLALWGCSFMLKICTFWFYWGARIDAGSHTEKMRAETATAEDRAKLAQEEHNQFVAANGFAVYIKNACPECEKAVGLLSAAGSQFGVKSVDDLEPGKRPDVLALLQELAHSEASEIPMPMIFSQQELVTDLSHLQALLDQKKVGSPSTEAGGEQAQQQDVPMSATDKEEENKDQMQPNLPTEDKNTCQMWQCPVLGEMMTI